MKGIRIGELATQCGVTPDTIRFYERKGLLPPPRRTGAGHRMYDEGAVRLLRFIRRSHDIGLGLADVQHLIRDRQRPGSLCRSLAERLRARHEVVARKLDALEATRRVLAEQLRRCEEARPEDCPVASFLEGNGDAPGGAAPGPRP